MRALNLLHIIALKERLPELVIVPAHDMRGFCPNVNAAASKRPVRRRHTFAIELEKQYDIDPVEDSTRNLRNAYFG